MRTQASSASAQRFRVSLRTSIGHVAPGIGRVAPGIGCGGPAHPRERVVDACAVVRKHRGARNACGRWLVGPSAARVDDRRQVERHGVVQVFPPRYAGARVAARLRDDADGSVAAVLDGEGAACPALFTEGTRRIGGGQVSGARRACVRTIIVQRPGAGEGCRPLTAAACNNEQEPGAGVQRIVQHSPLLEYHAPASNPPPLSASRMVSTRGRPWTATLSHDRQPYRPA